MVLEKKSSPKIKPIKNNVAISTAPQGGTPPEARLERTGAAAAA